MSIKTTKSLNMQKLLYKLYFFMYSCFFFFAPLSVCAGNTFIAYQNRNEVTSSTVDDIASLKYLNEVKPGDGYSSDRQQVSVQKCFNVEIINNNCEKTLNGERALTFDQLRDAFKINDYSKKNELFQKQPNYRLLFFHSEQPSQKNVEDSEFSLSLNFAYVIKNEINLGLKDYGIHALNSVGRYTYENYYEKFGLFCGDCYISRITKIAMLLVELDIHFDSHSEKEKFTQYTSDSSWFTFSSVTKYIENFGNRVAGQINLKVYQQGGDNERFLRDILSSDPNNNYYLVTCSINQKQACVAAAKKIIDYAEHSFSNQINCDTSKGLEILEYEYKPFDTLGLDVPTSLLTSEVLEARNELTKEISKYSLYANKVSEAINYYPSSWDKDNKFYNSVEKLAESSKNNLRLLNNSIKTCIDEPGKCINTKNDIMSKVALITPVDLKDLPTIADYKTYGSLSDFLNARGIADLYR